MPESIDDLTVQVALVRPGPIQGKAVHPYIEHRQKLREDPSFVPPVDHPSLAEPLRETLGVVVFQDQVLEVAMALAGFSVGEAEGLRRAMSRKRSEAAIEAFRERFIEGAAAKGVGAELANHVYDKLVGFSGFGFPKSHAAAFGLLAYQSAWLRHHYPAEFLCALLNEQPMGFYPPASLVRDAQRRDVEVRPPHLNRSEAKCSVEDGAVRVGLEYIESIGDEEAKELAAERARGGPFRTVVELAQRASLTRDGLESLIASGACDSLGSGARCCGSSVSSRARRTCPARAARSASLRCRSTRPPTLPTCASRPSGSGCSPTTGGRACRSASIRWSSCDRISPQVSSPAMTCARHRTGLRWSWPGWLVARQRPATAKGVVFMLLEDELGQINLIVPPAVYERHRALVRGEPLILARGRFERVQRNQNVLVSDLETLAPLARRISGAPDLVDALPEAHHFGHR